MSGVSQADKRRKARAEVLLETARAYAWGAATDKEVLDAADAYGETCDQDGVTSGESRSGT